MANENLQVFAGLRGAMDTLLPAGQVEVTSQSEIATSLSTQVAILGNLTLPCPSYSSLTSMYASYSMDFTDVQGSLECRGATSKAKTSPKKCGPTTKANPRVGLVNNNNEEFDKQRIDSNVHVEKTRELAALLLQRQIQVWLLQRHENLRLQEVHRLREELRKAAVCVIQTSYKRRIKRQAIRKFLQERAQFETQLNELLEQCIVRKQKLEEVQRFATLRRQQQHNVEETKRNLIRAWLVRCVQARNTKKYQTIARAHEKLKEALQYRRRVHQGLEKLFSTFHLVVLRGAQFRWYDQVQKEKMIHGAATKLQRVYRAHQLRARFVQIRESCLMVQRVIRAYLARGRYAELRRRKFQELSIHQRRAAATTIQRYARGYQIRLWFRDVLFKLRERFRCANCGAIEPGGAYCKYCGRHRTTFGPLSNVLQLHEKWPLGRSVFSSKAGPDEPSLRNPKVPPSRSTSLRNFTSCTVDRFQKLTTLPVLPPHHSRLVVHPGNRFAHSNMLAKASISPLQRSISSITEQTALRAIALSDLQATEATSTREHVLEMHIRRLQKANMAINRGSFSRRASFD